MKTPATRITTTVTTMTTPRGPAEELLPVAEGASSATKPGAITLPVSDSTPHALGMPSTRRSGAVRAALEADAPKGPEGPCQRHGYAQLRQESTSVEPSTAMQNDVDGHDTDVSPMPEFTDVGADQDFPL